MDSTSTVTVMRSLFVLSRRKVQQKVRQLGIAHNSTYYKWEVSIVFLEGSILHCAIGPSWLGATIVTPPAKMEVGIVGKRGLLSWLHKLLLVHWILQQNMLSMLLRQYFA